MQVETTSCEWTQYPPTLLSKDIKKSFVKEEKEKLSFGSFTGNKPQSGRM